MSKKSAKKRGPINPERAAAFFGALVESRPLQFAPPERSGDSTTTTQKPQPDPYREHCAIGDQKLTGPYT